MHKLFTIVTLVCLTVSSRLAADVRVTSLGTIQPPLSHADENQGTQRKWQQALKILAVPAERVAVRQVATDVHGNTSVRNESELTWKEQGYFQRCRDLGQVFTAPRDFKLDALVLRTGNDRLAFKPGAAGAEIFIQFLTVAGKPRIDDNGTPEGTRAKHGWSDHHRCDDFIRGVTYTPLKVARGGRLPDLTAGDAEGRLTYLKFDFTGDDELELTGGQQYALMIGFAEPGKLQNFTLANRNHSHLRAPPSLERTPYDGGWGLRREGNGRVPPQMVPGSEPPADETIRTALLEQSRFPAWEARLKIPPTTDGYPDVDTYRDLEFYLLAAKRADE